MNVSLIFSNRNIATFFMVLMCIQILPIEGYGVSFIKVAAMALSPLILITKVPYISKATILCTIYYLFCIFTVLLQGNNFRASTVIYLGLFLSMFVMYYNLIYSGAFTIDYAIRVVTFILSAYIIVLLLQQMLILLGVRYFPPFNLISFLNRGIGANSLSQEPSSAARIMAICFLAFLKLHEYKNGVALSIKELFVKYRKLTLGFLWAMITMGSGTAFVALAILLFYFIKKQYILFTLPFLFILYIAIPYIDYEPMNRAVAVFGATLSGDSDVVVETDGSAAVRVAPMLNIFNALTIDNLSSKEFLFGRGIDSAKDLKFVYSKLSGGIDDYGFIAYILSLVLVLACCVPKFWSLETLMGYILCGLAVTNIAYIWGILLIFTMQKYFANK